MARLAPCERGCRLYTAGTGCATPFGQIWCLSTKKPPPVFYPRGADEGCPFVANLAGDLIPPVMNTRNTRGTWPTVSVDSQRTVSPGPPVPSIARTSRLPDDVGQKRPSLRRRDSPPTHTYSSSAPGRDGCRQSCWNSRSICRARSFWPLFLAIIMARWDTVIASE